MTRWLGLAAGCLALGGPASADEYRPDPAVPLASCEAVGAEADLDGRDGIAGRDCVVAPGLSVAVLSDDTAAWPVVSSGRGARTSLEDPVARKSWFPDTSPPRVRYRQDELTVWRDAHGDPARVHYTGFVSLTDRPGNLEAFVVLCLKPETCALAVVLTEAEAEAIALQNTCSCLPGVEMGGERH